MKSKILKNRKSNHIILFGYINEPPGGGGGGGGGYDPGYPTYPGTGGGGGESTGDGMGGTLPHGTLSSDGQEQVGTTFFAPYITSFVRFRYRSIAAPFPPFTVQTRALGGWNPKTSVANLVTYTTVDVPIDASNYTVQIRFQTADSNGGLVNWQAMHT